MDILDVLSFDERIIVLTSKEDRSIITWNQSDTFQWWRPVVRIEDPDSFDPNNWEEVAILTQSGYGPKTFEQARTQAELWINGVIDR